jgi:hypothetical protein
MRVVPTSVQEEIDAALPQERERRILGFVEVDRDVGPGPPQAAQPVRNELADEEAARVNGQRSPEGSLAHRTNDAGKSLEKRLHELVEHAPFGRRRHAILRRAREELHPELRLELADLLVHGGLRDWVGKGPRRARVSSGPGHVEEALEPRDLNRVHHGSSDYRAGEAHGAQYPPGGTYPPTGRRDGPPERRSP